ncbi:glycerate kinase [Chitinimonas arctica]|uniref:Glycerate kinase n=1 Tax=Chitinimonas arctica TaxID=2594795 RepID=A0A516SLT4_9NEIS|nr:glycerate kinase [Chitinimonas arctica]QDQ29113.1 glycerate kinase [Chitinimonas arctica]
MPTASLASAIVLAPDSFKGTLSATAVANAMADGIRRVRPQADLRMHPMADGGEGTLEAIAAAVSAQWRHGTVVDLAGKPVEARWLSLADGTAVLESAEVIGLGRAGDSEAARRDSTGLGQLLGHVLTAGFRRVLIGLGGTGSNDGGAGMLQALGARLCNAQGQAIGAGPAGLADLASIDLSGLDPRLQNLSLLGLADVASPLSGPQGATAVFGPQKGVAVAEVARFDGYLARLGDLGDAARGAAYAAEPGSGAAGGLGWAMRILGAKLVPGAARIAELQGLDRDLAQAGWALTGEGRSDAQTLLGKVPCLVAARAAHFGVPTVLLSGSLDDASLSVLKPHFHACLALCDGVTSQDEAMRDAARLVADRSERWARSVFPIGA